ncbi:XdhC family protein [Novosphingobium sp.]|uniref:XdhC family protein n=1 Tax=Novosphingobium sp. TaxID=1874826 RepID=UPI003D11E4A7
MIAAHPVDALRLIDEGAHAGIGGVLITLTGIERSSSRAIGTQMAVLADGRHVGSFSGGCIESAIIAEAIEVLAAGAPRQVRYGIGSPYIDVRLPCGGGIDLLFMPNPDRAAIADALARLDRREPATLQLGDHIQHYVPRLRLVTLGHGEDVLALVRLARVFGLDVEAYAPNDEGADVDGVLPLVSRTALPTLTGDAWTAFVFVFHDHDWEEFLLPQALGLRGFYYGAVGSPRTHQARLDALRAAGVPGPQVDALRGSIGLIPATRHPATLALSILAELVQHYEACAARNGWVGRSRELQP